VRIERMVVRNYRQYEDLDVRFPKQTRDIHVFVAMNGTGKSNLVNAINWCLYGDEPHLSDVSKSLPLLSLGAIRKGRGGQVETSVQLWLLEEDRGPITFVRTVRYEIVDGKPMESARDFEASSLDREENTGLLSGQQAQGFVERILPKSLRGFFLFDGERLDNYFRRETGQQIRNSVFEISQVDLLKRLEEHLGEVVKDLAREAGRNDPTIGKTQETLELTQAGIDRLDREIEQTKRQVAAAQDHVKKLQERLSSLPDAKAMEERRRELTERVKEDIERIKELESSRRELIVTQYTTLALLPAIAGAMDLINSKQDSGEIPPSVDPVLLRQALRQSECFVCGRELDDRAVATINTLLQKHQLSTHIGTTLLAVKHPLRIFLDSPGKARDELRSLRDQIARLTKREKDVDAQVAQIDIELAHHDLEAIRQLQAQRATWEQVERDKLLEMGRLGGSKTIAENLARGLGQKRDQELRKKAKADQISLQVELASTALRAVQAAREEIMSETRSRVAAETNRLFFELVWKKHSFKEVSIGEDYSLSVAHNMGFECMGSLSAAETELLALSFTLALHHVSGFDSPLLIDTPVARVSDISRENFASVLADVSAGKQTIVLFTPSEYSSELAGVIDPVAVKHKLVLAPDEMSVCMEGY